MSKYPSRRWRVSVIAGCSAALGYLVFCVPDLAEGALVTIAAAHWLHTVFPPEPRLFL
jgi:hypothetical protein